MKEKRWRVNSADQEKAEGLFDALKIHPVLCRILTQRGITTYEEAHSYFAPN
jgi:single-stranded-DNA-specific exonuclease